MILVQIFTGAAAAAAAHNYYWLASGMGGRNVWTILFVWHVDTILNEFLNGIALKQEIVA